MKQAVSFGLLFGGGILLTSALTDSSIADVITGKAGKVPNQGSALSVAGVGSAVSSAASSTGTAIAGSGSGGTPFPQGWTPNRLDAGYDGDFKGQIAAPFSGTITYASRSFSNWGGYLELKADGGTIPGLRTDTLYFAEGLFPTVTAGQHVTAGQQIAVPGTVGAQRGVPGNIEWGPAIPGSVGTPTDPLVHAVSDPAAMVISFADWAVKTLGVAPPSQTSHAGSG